MPLAIRKVPPDAAFSVQYQGQTITIYHAYEDDMVGKQCSHVYTADEAEGVRDGQRLSSGRMGSKYGYTEDEDRNDFFFDTAELYDTMKLLCVSELNHANREYACEWDDKFIVQAALDHGLIGFDDDFRFVDAQRISNAIKSCTGGLIQPYEIKAVSNG